MTKKAEIANSVDPDEVAHHNESPHLDLLYLASSFFLVDETFFFFLKLYKREFCRLLFAAEGVKVSNLPQRLALHPVVVQQCLQTTCPCSCPCGS